MRRSSRSSAAAASAEPQEERQHDAAMSSPSSSHKKKAATRPASQPSRASSASRSKKAKAEAVDEAEHKSDPDGSDAEDTTAAAEDEPRPKRRHASDAASSSSSSAAAASSSSSAAAAPSNSDDDAAEDADDIEALAAAAGVSVYEFNRQQNIRLKNEQLQALNLAGMASDIGLRRAAPAPRSSTKRKSREPAVGVRRSGRSAGVPAEIYVPELTTSASSTWGRPDRKEGPLSFAEALGVSGAAPAEEEEEGGEEKEGAASMEDEGEESKQADKAAPAAAAASSSTAAAAAGASKPAAFSAEVESVLSALTSCLKLSTPSAVAQASSAVIASYGQKGALGLGQMRMAGEGVKIIKSRATVLSFHPTAAIDSNASIVAVGDKEGNVSLARYSNKAAQKDWAATVQVARFAPHTQSVVGLLWGSAGQSHNLYSASQDGSVRRMDLDTQQWLEAFVAPDDGDGVSAVCMAPDYSSLYCGDRGGVMTLVDQRGGSSQSKHSRHTLSTHKLNGLAVNPLDCHMLASCGNERKVRVWDVRNLSKHLREWTHGFSVNAVTFSPSGRMMATTSYDDTIKIFSCVNASGALLAPTEWAAEKIIKHDNHTGRWVTTFRSMFSPVDAAIAIGNMKRAIDVYTFPTIDSAAIAAASAASSAAAASADSSTGNGKKKRGAGAAAAAAASSSSASAAFSKSGPSVSAPPPSAVMSLTHSEYVTSIPSAIAWEPNRVAVAGVTSSGRLYVFGHFGK